MDSSKNHGILFLPEVLVLHADEYARQKQEEGTPEAQEAKKWGISISEYREQMRIMKEAQDAKKNRNVSSAGSRPDDSLAPFMGLDRSKSVRDVLTKDKIEEQRQLLEECQKENQPKNPQQLMKEEKYEVVCVCECVSDVCAYIPEMGSNTLELVLEYS